MRFSWSFCRLTGYRLFGNCVRYRLVAFACRPVPTYGRAFGLNGATGPFVYRKRDIIVTTPTPVTTQITLILAGDASRRIYLAYIPRSLFSAAASAVPYTCDWGGGR